ncbi:MAG: methylated-DNA--[protein]-cysteine S-methyltransferase [Desulforhopalus sp.]
MKDYCYYQSPIGQLMLIGTNGVLEELLFPNEVQEKSIDAGFQHNEKIFEPVLKQLREYFAGKRQRFSLKLAPNGTEFQQRVWQELCNIPYGQTTSYGEVASRLGNPKGGRAVGMANGKNPIPIIVPCHRVIGKDGSLTGFGGGLDIKRHLLDLENQSRKI